MKYITLLRGINVGGNNKIAMPKLIESFINNSFTDVVTHINTGNIIFSSTIDDTIKINSAIEAFILKDFNLEITSITLSEETFKEILLQTNPAWQNDDNQKTDIMFLWPQLDNPEVTKELEINKSIETLTYVPGALFWNIKRAFVSSSKLEKLVGTRKYKFMTVRNINTVRRLLDILDNNQSKL